MIHHVNALGPCPKCEELFNRYPGFDGSLYVYFNQIRSRFADAHISCAGRGKVEQEADVMRGASRAHWLKSAHNFNAAIDIFRLLPTGKIDWDDKWFFSLFRAFPLGASFKWYGSPGAEYYERPHVERADWKKACTVPVHDEAHA